MWWESSSKHYGELGKSTAGGRLPQIKESFWVWGLFFSFDWGFFVCSLNKACIYRCTFTFIPERCVQVPVDLAPWGVISPPGQGWLPPKSRSCFCRVPLCSQIWGAVLEAAPILRNDPSPPLSQQECMQCCWCLPEWTAVCQQCVVWGIIEPWLNVLPKYPAA